jgi:outer membrane murein-binding lipoprotein Lpp
MRLTLVVLAVLVASTVLAVTALSKDAEAPQPSRLEEKVRTLEDKVLKLRTELKATRTVQAKLLRYLDGQAKAAEGLAKALDESEKAGFTYGQNFKSREILLSGFRKRIAAVRQGLPAAPKEMPTR